MTPSTAAGCPLFKRLAGRCPPACRDSPPNQLARAAGRTSGGTPTPGSQRQTVVLAGRCSAASPHAGDTARRTRAENVWGLLGLCARACVAWRRAGATPDPAHSLIGDSLAGTGVLGCVCAGACVAWRRAGATPDPAHSLTGDSLAGTATLGCRAGGWLAQRLVKIKVHWVPNLKAAPI